jgi:hypothetical protein
VCLSFLHRTVEGTTKEVRGVMVDQDLVSAKFLLLVTLADDDGDKKLRLCRAVVTC